MPAPEWSDPAHIERYLSRAHSGMPALTGEEALLEQIPADTRRLLDLGTGDGRLIALLLDGHPQRTGVGIDSSAPMLEAAARRFDGDKRVELVRRDLAEPLGDLGGGFDAIVSSLAIHHLEDERKRSLYGEAFTLLSPGGLFANLEHVASPSRRLHLEFFTAIDEPLEHEDPSDRLLDVATQLRWLREIGFADVDCHWKWRELALIAGVRPAPPTARSAPRGGEVAVRAAREEDWEEIWPILQAIVAAGETIAYDRELGEAQARELWLGPGGRTSVATDARDRVLGSAHMHANRGGPGAHVASATYVVAPAEQGRGVGRALVLDSLDWARDAGFGAMQFNAVAETNRAAIALYRSLAFEVVGTVPGAFEHPEHGLTGLHVMYRAL
jgi:SAM-dependent methyltransferase